MVSVICVAQSNSQPIDNCDGTFTVVLQPGSGFNDGTDVGGADNGKDASVLAGSLGSGSSPNSWTQWSFEFDAQGYAYYQFDLNSVIAIDDQIESAKLVVSQSTKSGRRSSRSLRTGTFVVESVAGEWDEMTIDWNNQPGTDGFYSKSAEVEMNPVSFIESVSIDITPLAVAWQNGVVENNGVIYRMKDQGFYKNIDNYVYSSDYADDPALRPKLEITYATSTASDTSCDNDVEALLSGFDVLVEEIVELDTIIAQLSEENSKHSSESAESDEEEDSDRPPWAGVPGKEGKPGKPNDDSGTKKGGLFGDMYVLYRDKNGVPYFSDEGFVQPIDADGNLIELDEDGHPTVEGLAIEVELGRLNVGRSPESVLENRYEEARSVIEAAEKITLDASGRLLLTIAGEEKTIDSPLENLSIYVKLMNTGTLDLDPAINPILGDLNFLNDEKFDSKDMMAAVSFFAAAADKYAPIGIDKLVYVNTILGIEGTITTEHDDYKYVDFDEFVYRRRAAYRYTEAEVLLPYELPFEIPVGVPEEAVAGLWKLATVNIYDKVFNQFNYKSYSGVKGFAQAADDARKVIAFTHDLDAPVLVEEGSH